MGGELEQLDTYNLIYFICFVLDIIKLFFIPF